MTGIRDPQPSHEQRSTAPLGPPTTPNDTLSLREFYEHAPCGYVSLLADDTVARVNATALAWTGLIRDEVVGGPFAALLTVASRSLYADCGPALLAGDEVDQVALDLQCADGSELPVLLAAKVHATGADGTPQLVRVTLVDVSSRRRFEQELIARNEELSTANAQYDVFAHAVAHDLQAPLRGIRLRSEYLLEDVREGTADDAEEQLVAVVRLADRMKGMLDSLLTYSQAGRAAWTPQAVSLPDVVADVVDLLGPRAEDAHIAVAEAAFTADPDALRQVLLNLIGNAIKYAGGPAAEIAVGVCSLGDAARRSTLPQALMDVPADRPVLSVSDGGIGIPPAKHEQIFDLFRQLDQDAEGSGTGLALCRMICRRDGGDIWVSSELGEGSTFYVLPRP